MTWERIIILALFILGAVSIQIWLAVTVIRKREPISTIKLMREELTATTKELKETRADQQRSHQRILLLEKTVSKLESIAGEQATGIKALIKQLELLNQTPAYSGSSVALQEIVSAAAAAFVARDRSKLQKHIAQRFSLEEMDDLAFQLEIEDGQLKDDGTKAGRARAIINHMIRREQQDVLIEKLEEVRPEQEW